MTSSEAPRQANRPPPGELEEARRTPTPAGDGGDRGHETATFAAAFDSGEPISDPPPLVEPEFIGFDEPPATAEPAPSEERRAAPPLVARVRRWRPPVRPPAADAAAAAAVPAIVEPVAEPAQPATPRQPTRATPTAESWRPVVYWARWVAAAIVLAGALYLAGLGRFAHVIPSHGAATMPLPVPSDPAERFAYYQKGAQGGDSDAELHLAILYAKGDGVTQDFAAAAYWFRAAADKGSARAQYDLGVLYERGRGVPADPEQAASWYLKAAEGKYPLAEYNLAVAYTKGQGTRKDPAEAALWYRRAATQGVVQAMVTLGTAYERGDGVAVSPVDAYAWYLAAGRRGNQAAAHRADDLFAAMAQLDQIRATALASDVAASIHDPPAEPGGN